jgi:hypothetical protein
MTYKLFLDDVRELAHVHPGEDPTGWQVCRSFREATEAVARGWPSHVSFDHDLGENVPSGMDFARFLVELDLLMGQMPEGFTFSVHSANPPGAANIQGLLDNYLEHRGK